MLVVLITDARRHIHNQRGRALRAFVNTRLPEAVQRQNCFRPTT